MTKKAAKAQAQTQTTEGAAEPAKKSNHVQRILEQRKKDSKIDPLLESQFSAGRLYAAISSRPGQSGRSDGYILEGKELEVSGAGSWSMGSLHTLTRGFSSTLGRFGQGSRSMRTVHEYIVACSIFFSKTFAWSVCCTSSKDTYMRASGSASPLVSHRVGMSCAVRSDCRPRDETDAAAAHGWS